MFGFLIVLLNITFILWLMFWLHVKYEIKKNIYTVTSYHNVIWLLLLIDFQTFTHTNTHTYLCRKKLNLVKSTLHLIKSTVLEIQIIIYCATSLSIMYGEQTKYINNHIGKISTCYFYMLVDLDSLLQYILYEKCICMNNCIVGNTFFF